VMILVDGVIVDRVAVSSSIMESRVGDYRTAAGAWPSSCPTEGGNARRDSSLPRTSRAEGQGAAVVSIWWYPYPSD
jgi:hypothetical protein